MSVYPLLKSQAGLGQNHLSAGQRWKDPLSIKPTESRFSRAQPGDVSLSDKHCSAGAAGVFFLLFGFNYSIIKRVFRYTFIKS